MSVWGLPKVVPRTVYLQNLKKEFAVQEEFMSAYSEQMTLMKRQEEIQKGLEECGEDMDKMSALLDELQVQIKCPPVYCDAWLLC